MLIEGKPELGRVVLAHGAGASLESEFMTQVASRLAALGLQVVRFNFPYMEKSQLDGKRRPPDRMPQLLGCFESVVREVDDGAPLFLVGKSMGGRVATMLTTELDARAAFIFGYPFHPRGKPDNLRVEHLHVLDKPVHIFQGERDPMGSFAEVTGYNLPPFINLHWLADGDHDLKPRKASGYNQMQHLDSCIEMIKEQLRELV